MPVSHFLCGRVSPVGGSPNRPAHSLSHVQQAAGRRRRPTGSGGAAPAAAARPRARRAGLPVQCSSSSGSSSNGSSSSEDGVGVVIVDHGSRKAESNDMLLEFAELYKRVTGRRLVEVAHMELAEPTIEQAVGRCAAAGARRVVIAPYFLSRGRHVQQDIPALAAGAAAAHPSVQCVLAEPIGIDALMAQLIENRVASAQQSGEAVAPAEAVAGAAPAGP